MICRPPQYNIKYNTKLASSKLAKIVATGGRQWAIKCDNHPRRGPSKKIIHPRNLYNSYKKFIQENSVGILHLVLTGLLEISVKKLGWILFFGKNIAFLKPAIPTASVSSIIFYSTIKPS